MPFSCWQLFAVLCCFSPASALANRIVYQGSQCSDSRLDSELSGIYSAAPCSVYPGAGSSVATATEDPPSAAWSGKSFVHFDRFADANCRTRLDWFRVRTSDTVTRTSAWGQAYKKCELTNGVETTFDEVVSTGDRQNVYETQKCLLDVNVGDSYYIASCVRSSTLDVPVIGNTGDTNATARLGLEIILVFCACVVLFF